MVIDHLKLIELDSKFPVRAIRSDNGTELRNALLNDFCVDKGISRQYSAPRTSKQNGVVERKNRTLIEVARTMLSELKLPMYFWAEAVNTTCYTQNRTLINKDLTKTSYEIMNGKKPTLKYFHVFDAKCFVLKDGDDHRGNFKAKSHEAVFVSYSRRSYRVYIIGQHQVKESVNVTFDDTKLPNIQTKDASEKLKFNNLSDPDFDDEDTQPEIGADDNNVNNDGDHGEGGGNIDLNGESTDTGEESSRNLGNNSGEMLKDHLVIHNIKMSFKGNHQDQFLQSDQFGAVIILLS